MNGLIGAVDIVEVRDDSTIRDIAFTATDVEHGEQIVQAVKELDGVDVVNVSDRTFLIHLGGKIEIRSKVPVKTRDDLSMAYTPRVARVCRAIFADPESAFALTIRRNTVAVVTDGSAVLRMGNIGPRAASSVSAVPTKTLAAAAKLCATGSFRSPQPSPTLDSPRTTSTIGTKWGVGLCSC
jgi:malate dehydrogenase (oxaloacetate-decarboxylating)